MDKSPLVTEQINAGERLIREFSKKIPVQAAFWLRERDSDEWYFYLASDQINDSNFDRAYGEVHRIARPQQSLWLDPFQVKVIGIDDPVAKAALDVMKKYPGQIPTRYHGRHFGGLSIDEVYIYPLPLPVSA
jgi:hypothetical protein